VSPLSVVPVRRESCRDQALCQLMHT
jgi:hypothetical protein